jgi:hypothetical protein
VKWGRNAAYGSVPSRLRGKGKGGFACYRNASALECVVGFLYMTNLARLEVGLCMPFPYMLLHCPPFRLVVTGTTRLVESYALAPRRCPRDFAGPERGHDCA